MPKIKNISNLEIVIKELLNSSINNAAFHIGILCVIAKESNFELKEEKGYQNTSNKRILNIFGKKLPKKYHEHEEELNKLKKDPEAFFNLVYGNRNGNSNPGDGYKYRGRGFNQLTFKGNYRNYSTKEYNLVKNPELMNNPIIAAKVMIDFFERQYKSNKKKFLRKFNIESIKDLSIVEEGILLAANLNAGAAKSITSSTVKNAYNNALKYKEEIMDKYYNYIYKNPYLIKE